MLMPHLILVRPKNNQDESANKILARRLESWLSHDFDRIFNEARAIQERLQKVNHQKRLNSFKEFDKHLESGKHRVCLTAL